MIDGALVRPASFGQERLWFIDRLAPDSSIYNMPAAWRLCGDLDVQALERALAAIVARHETLRTTFVESDGVPMQRIVPGSPISVSVCEVSEQQLDRSLREASRERFDLARGPLFRARLFRLGAREHVLLVVMHHIISDGWSISVLARDLELCYGALAAGRDPALGEPEVRYRDHTDRQRAWCAGGDLAGDLDWWRSCLGVAPPAELPSDRPRASRSSHRGDVIEVDLPASLVDALGRIAREEGATLFMAAMAVLQVLLHRYTRMEEFVLGTFIAGRTAVDTEALIGFFVNSLAVPADLRDDPTFRDVVRSVRGTLLDVFEHAEVPFEKVVEALRPVRDPSRNPLFQVALAFEDAEPESWTTAGVTATPVAVRIGAAKLDLTVEWHRREGRSSIVIEYAADLFERETIVALSGHLRRLVEGVVADPSVHLSRLSLLTPAERDWLVEVGTGPSVDLPDETVDGLIAKRAADTPAAVAVVGDGLSLTYGDLDAAAEALAHRLVAHGVGEETVVGLLCSRCPDLVVGMLAIMKAGGAYLPLDPDYPLDRLRYMIEDAGASVVLSQPHLRSLVIAPEVTVLDLDGQLARERGHVACVPSAGSADRLAYVIYTSGSTGRPKGTEVTHRNIVRLLVGQSYARFGPDRTFLQLAALSFDAATFEIWGPLVHGGRLVLFEDRVPSVTELRRVVQAHGVTTLWLTAGLFNAIVDESPDTLDGVDEILTGGEALSVPHVRRALDRLPDAQLINGYGPTEATTFACCWRIDRSVAIGGSVPIGKPIANTSVAVVGPSDEPVPVGVPGELLIGGLGVARGYRNRPELTEERFVSNDVLGRAYRTGDLVRWRGDGTLEFLGRMDDQVKVRGFRVEPGEVEAALAELPDVQQAAVVAADDGTGRSLVGFVVATTARSPTPLELLDELRETLPPFMVPSRLFILDALPLDPNGKVDRGELRGIAASPTAVAASHTAPRDPAEAEIAAMCQELLGRDEPVGVRDDFFEVGGHSLLAVRLLARVAQRFGRELPLSLFYEEPTIERLARAVDAGDVPLERAVIELNPVGHRPALVVVHAQHSLAALARHLGPEQPVIGLLPPGLDRAVRPLTSVAALSEHYVELLERRPGPYRLFGACLGGLIAYEMASRLREAGRSVELLVMLDAWVPGSVPSRSIWDRAGEKDLHGLSRPRALAFYVVTGIRRRRWSRLQKKSASGRVPRWALRAANQLAVGDHRPGPYGDRTVLLRAERGPRDADPAEAWRVLVSNLDVRDVTGRHGTQFMDPHVRELARILTPLLGEAPTR